MISYEWEQLKQGLQDRPQRILLALLHFCQCCCTVGCPSNLAGGDPKFSNRMSAVQCSDVRFVYHFGFNISSAKKLLNKYYRVLEYMLPPFLGGLDGAMGAMYPTKKITRIQQKDFLYYMASNSNWPRNSFTHFSFFMAWQYTQLLRHQVFISSLHYSHNLDSTAFILLDHC